MKPTIVFTALFAFTTVLISPTHRAIIATAIIAVLIVLCVVHDLQVRKTNPARIHILDWLRQERVTALSKLEAAKVARDQEWKRFLMYEQLLETQLHSIDMRRNLERCLAEARKNGAWQQIMVQMSTTRADAALMWQERIRRSLFCFISAGIPKELVDLYAHSRSIDKPIFRAVA
jgi:hypothetical protein